MSNELTAAGLLHGTLRGLIAKHAPDRDWLSLGVMQADGGLLVKGDAESYPQGTFLTARSLLLPDPIATVIAVDPQGGTVTVAVPRPAALAPPSAGDMVLVAWLQEQQMPVIVCILGRAP